MAESRKTFFWPSGPRERLLSLTEGVVLGDPAVAEHEAIGKPAARPVDRVGLVAHSLSSRSFFSFAGLCGFGGVFSIRRSTSSILS